MKRQYSLLFLFVFALCSSVIGMNRVAGEEPSNETKSTALAQGPDIFSQLFPTRGRIYPTGIPASAHDFSVKPYAPMGWQYTAKKILDETYLDGSMKNMFYPNALPQNMSVIYIPDPEGKDVSGFLRRAPHLLISFYLDEVNVTVVWARNAVAVTFDYEENPKAPKKLEAVHQELSRLLPVMNHLVLDYNIPKNKDVYEGKDFDESKLYCAEAKKEKVLDERWVKSVRWWRGCGRFGISFDSMTPWEIGGGTHYDTRDTYGERL